MTNYITGVLSFKTQGFHPKHFPADKEKKESKKIFNSEDIVYKDNDCVKKVK